MGWNHQLDKVGFLLVDLEVVRGRWGGLTWVPAQGVSDDSSLKLSFWFGFHKLCCHNSFTEIVTKLNWSSEASIPSATCWTKKHPKFTLLPLPVLRLVPPAWCWPFSCCWSSWYIPILVNSRLSRFRVLMHFPTKYPFKCCLWFQCQF